MKRFVETFNQIEGFHRYPDAPKECIYLSARHRHIFAIRCAFQVSHNNRELEINTMQNQIEDYLTGKYGRPAELNSMSCEDIAEELMNKFDCSFVQVLEDNYGGATLSR